MGAPIAASQLSDWLKRVYPKEADDTLVKCAILVNNTDLGEFDQVGNSLVIPVVVQGEQGITYGAPSSTAQTRGSIALKIVNATVNPPMISIKSTLPADTVQRAKDNASSFGRANKLRFDSQKESLLRRGEMMYLYGGDPLGWASVNGAPSVSGTTATIVISKYAPAFFSTLVGAELDVYSTGGTHRTVNAPIVIAGFNMATNTLSVTGNATDLGNIADTDLIFGYGAKGVEGVGILQQISVRGDAGFGIDNTLYPTFQGQVYPVGGALTYAQCAAALALVQRFLPESTLTLFVDTNNFAALVKEQQANVRWVQGGKDADLGFMALDVTQGPTKAMIAAHPFLKDADAAIIPLDEIMVAGTNKDVFDTTSAGDLVVWDHNVLSYIYTMILCLQPFLAKPNWACRLTGITLS